MWKIIVGSFLLVLDWHATGPLDPGKVLMACVGLGLIAVALDAKEV